MSVPFRRLQAVVSILVALAMAPAPSRAADPLASNPMGIPITLMGVEGGPLAPGATVPLAFVAKNDGAVDLRVDAAGLRFHDSHGAPLSGFTQQPTAVPAILPARGTARFEFAVTASATAPTADVQESGTLFLYDTAVGTGRNLLANPSFEAGDYDPTSLPSTWSVVSDPPSLASWSWEQEGALSGGHAFTLTKTAAGGSSYLQQVVGANVLQPNTTYTYSGWINVPAALNGGFAELFLFWFDTEYHSVPIAPQVTGQTNGWKYVADTFTTGAAPIQQALVRAVVVGPAGSVAEFDNLALSQGAADGAITATDIAAPAPPPPPPADLPGDLDGDGQVTVKDATRGLRIAILLMMPTDRDLRLGDFNANGQIDVADVTKILRMVVGLGG